MNRAPEIHAEQGTRLDSCSSYGQILKSSSIIGGAQGINYLVGMVRTKLVAILLGPAGVGLLGLYTSATGLVSTIASLGISSSGVREVAEAHGTGDPKLVARTVKTLRRVCWVTGILGLVLTICLSYPLSLWAFGTGERAGALAILSITLLLSAVSGGQMALLQGTRRIADLARVNVSGVLLGTVVAVGLYAFLRERGIVPALIAIAAVGLICSWWFARRIPVSEVQMSWVETWHNSKRLIKLGLAFMWSGLLGAVVALIIRSLIVRRLGFEAGGVYEAAWGLSGVFAGFILKAMGADFYPRLTAAAQDNQQVNKLVNEQTEIGVLLAVPGLLATLAFAPWVMRFFYSSKFLPGAELLPWFVLGVFGQVISWPMGYILLAKGSGAWFIVTETSANLFRLALSVILLYRVGLWGAALAVPFMYVAYTSALLCLCRWMTGFAWSRENLRLFGLNALLILLGFAIQGWVPGYAGIGAGAALTVFSSVLCLRGIALRLGSKHWVSKMISTLPFMNRVLAASQP